MPAVSVRELWVRLGRLLPQGGAELNDPDRPVIIVADLGGGVRRALTCDADVRELVARRGGLGETVDIEVRDLFPTVGSRPRVVAMPIATLCRPGAAANVGKSDARRSPRTPAQRPASAGVRPTAPKTPPQRGRSGGSSRFRRHGQVAATTASRPVTPVSPPVATRAVPAPSQEGTEQLAPPQSALVPMPPQLAPVSSVTPVHPSLGPVPPKADALAIQQEGVTANPPSLRTLSPPQVGSRALVPEGSSTKEHPMEILRDPSPALPMPGSQLVPSEAKALDTQGVTALAPLEASPPRHAGHYDGRPGRLHDQAWESKTGELSAHLMEAIGLREEYEHLRFESGRRRQALEWLLRTRDSVPGPYSINLRPKASSAEQAEIAAQPCFSSVAEPDLVVPSTGPGDWDKGEFWPVKSRDVPKLFEAISKLAHMEGTAAVRLQDQEVFATWNLANARKRLADDHYPRPGVLRLVPRRVLVESSWLKFGEFSKVAFRVYPCGDGTAQPGNTTVFVWMAHPPGLSFTFNLRIGDTLSTAPRLWQATMIHYRMDLRWAQLSTALSTQDGASDTLSITLQVLQWHGPEENPADSSVEHHTNVSLALEMLQGAASASVAALAEQGVF
mmetsp:Transcript_60501/g.157195  ORF Transcript_60501/g.157195 Transcript_60501/m.157195 type:complete len:617 (+) Transcript_60501:87-1937(+)